MPEMQSSTGHRGAVRDPMTDGRLKHNRGNGIPKTVAARADVKRGGQGRVKNPGTDRRLKHNRYTQPRSQAETSPSSQSPAP